jgi:crotonobetainyl-CoA:carnitine CoA-transferase CaiB-like acyl-CoA transferase
MRFPLEGVRVIDLTRLLPGAFATQMLAELGAEVIKVEDPRGGDPMRRLPPIVDGRGLYDRLLNRGKKSVALDLKAAADRAGLDRLIARADVVVESFRPAAARRLGVDAASVRARHPGIVHCAITGYGQSGPYAERAGHDLNYVSLSGLLAADRPAVLAAGEMPRMFIADVGGGAMSAVIGILAALVGRGRGGAGAAIDIAMHEASLYWMMLPAAPELVAGGGAAAGELPTYGAHASYRVYRTKDGGHVALGALEAKFWRAFCESVGRPDLAGRHDSGAADQAALIDEVAAIVASRTLDEWRDAAAASDCCLTPVNTPGAALADPHVAARGVLVPSGGMRTIKPPFAAALPDLAPPPALGEHTGELLG